MMSEAHAVGILPRRQDLLQSGYNAKTSCFNLISLENTDVSDEAGCTIDRLSMFFGSFTMCRRYLDNCVLHIKARCLSLPNVR